MTTTNSFWIGFFSLLICLSHSPLAGAAELSPEKLEVKGRRLMHFYYKQTKMTLSFHLKVDGCRSWIRTQGNDPGTDYIEWGTDGTQSYLLHKDSGKPQGVPTVTPGPSRTLVEIHPQPSANQGTLELRWGTSPESSAQIPALWLTFASGCAFQLKKSGSELDGPLLFNSTIERERRHIRDRGYWNWSSINSNYFESFVCLRDDPRGFLSPYFGEQTNGVYKVVQWTNVAGQSFPSRTELQVFAADPASKDRYRPRTSYAIETFIDEIRPLGTNKVNFIGPKVGFFLWVTDHRVDPIATGKELVHYRTEDGTIKTIEQAEQLALEAPAPNPRKNATTPSHP